MNRTSFILGMALLVVAVTMAVTITVRNAPRDAGGMGEAGSTGRVESGDRAHPAGGSASLDRATGRTARAAGADAPREVYQVELPREQLVLLPVAERAELTARAAEVGSRARGQLDRMTEEFDLSGEQRRKMFPMLVRSTAGFDPRMQVGGVYLDSEPAAMPADEVHEVLDADQQAQLEDAELDRQLWWQDVFSRLEKELIDSTGGAAVTPGDEGGVAPVDGGGVAPVDNPATDGEERVAPAARRGGTAAE